MFFITIYFKVLKHKNKKYSEKLKIGHFKMSIFEKSWPTFVFSFFVFFKKVICEHYGKNGKKIIFNYAVEEFGRNCSYICPFLLFYIP
jgi:hypothetical protein